MMAVHEKSEDHQSQDSSSGIMNFTPIHPVVVEIIDSGAQWWTNQQTPQWMGFSLFPLVLFLKCVILAACVGGAEEALVRWCRCCCGEENKKI